MSIRGFPLVLNQKGFIWLLAEDPDQWVACRSGVAKFNPALEPLREPGTKAVLIVSTVPVERWAHIELRRAREDIHINGEWNDRYGSTLDLWNREYPNATELWVTAVPA